MADLATIITGAIWANSPASTWRAAGTRPPWRRRLFVPQEAEVPMP